MEETYEIFCDECGKLFESTDCDCMLCDDCWYKIVKIENEGCGEG